MMATPAGALGTPSGNAAAVHLYVKAAIATSKVPYVQFVTKNFYYLGYLANGDFNMAWGYPRTPHAYEKHVNATEIAYSRDGRNVWEEITFTEACPAHKPCAHPQSPLRLYLTKSAAYYSVLNGPGSTSVCWINATKTWVKTDLDSYGDPNWYPGTGRSGSTAGVFEPATTSGGTTTFVSTFWYEFDTSKVTETDTVSRATDLFTHASYHIGKAQKGVYLPYAYTQSLSVPKVTIKAPKIARIC
jgi:hypothetical protein